MRSQQTSADVPLILLCPVSGNRLAFFVAVIGISALLVLTGLLSAWGEDQWIAHLVVAVGGVLGAASIAGAILWYPQRPLLIIEDTGITDRLWPRHPLTIPRDQIEAVILFRQWGGTWLGLRVRDVHALLAAFPRLAKLRRRYTGLPDGVSFILCDDCLPISVHRLAREIGRRYGVPVGLGEGMGAERHEED